MIIIVVVVNHKVCTLIESNQVHSEHIDFLCHLQFDNIQRLKHLGCQYIMNCKFSNIHHVLSEPDGTSPEMTIDDKFNVREENFFNFFAKIKCKIPAKCTVKF